MSHVSFEIQDVVVMCTVHLFVQICPRSVDPGACSHWFVVLPEWSTYQVREQQAATSKEKISK